MKLKLPKKIYSKSIQDYFKKYNLKFDLNKSKEKNILRPDLEDLYFIHNFIILNKRINILEIGTGWSSYVISVRPSCSASPVHWMRSLLSLKSKTMSLPKIVVAVPGGPATTPPTSVHAPHCTSELVMPGENCAIRQMDLSC